MKILIPDVQEPGELAYLERYGEVIDIESASAGELVAPANLLK